MGNEEYYIGMVKHYMDCIKFIEDNDTIDHSEKNHILNKLEMHLCRLGAECRDRGWLNEVDTVIQFYTPDPKKVSMSDVMKIIKDN